MQPIETSYVMELTIGECAAVTHRLTFLSMEAAKAQLDQLEPKLGHGKFRNDPENSRHRIIADDGEMIVVVEHVQGARIVDHAKFRQLMSFADEKEIALNRAIRDPAT